VLVFAAEGRRRFLRREILIGILAIFAAVGILTGCGSEETQRSSEARDREEVE
jgi:hypothetical protein